MRPGRSCPPGAALASLLLLACGAATALSAEPPTANQAAREWFQDARFGMFIHWGVYSVPARGEWVMEHEHIPVSEYEKFAPQFNPTHFSAHAIVALAKRAGMKYITITSKHHDGFAMWATRQSPLEHRRCDPVQAGSAQAARGRGPSPGHQALLLSLAARLAQQRLLAARAHRPLRRPPPGGNFDRYLDYMNAQLTELLTQYGEIGGIWFDGMWDKPDAEWHLERTYSLIHRLQPAALIGNNHHHTPFPGEDFQMFEQDLPGANTAGFNQTAISTLPLETCETINHSWGYTRDDKAFKSVPELIRYLVRAAGANANLLLNVGPTSEGVVQPEFVERLEAMGDWLAKYGETIYGTREGPITPRSWGVTTAKGKRIYLHILNWQEPYLVLPPLEGIRSASEFNTHRKLELKPIEGAMLLAVPPGTAHSVDRIVVLER